MISRLSKQERCTAQQLVVHPANRNARTADRCLKRKPVPSFPRHHETIRRKAGLFCCSPSSPTCLCRRFCQLSLHLQRPKRPQLPRTVLESEGSLCSHWPPITTDPPALFDSIWLHGQEAWVRAAINEPIQVCNNGAGVPWSSTVHVLGITHDCPYNPRAIQEAADAVQPDGIACELSDGMKNRTKKAAASHHLLAPLEKALSTPITSLRQAHCELLTREDRVKWELGMSSQKLGLERAGLEHYVFGKLDFSECLAAVRVACKRNATLTLTDTDERGREAYISFTSSTDSAPSLPSRPTGDLECSAHPAAREPDPGDSGSEASDPRLPAALRSRLKPFQNPALDASILQWLLEMQSASDNYPPKLAELFLALTLSEAFTPDQRHTFIQLNPRPPEIQAANASRERAMAHRILELCSGSLTGKPCKRVLVITGKAHVMPLRALLSSQP